MGKPEYICYNKHIQMTEPEWTPEQEEILQKFYEEADDKSKVDINDVME